MTQWSWHYEKQGGKRKCILQNILHSRTKSDRHSLLVANHWKNCSLVSISRQYFSVSVNIDMLHWWEMSLCFSAVPSRQKHGDPGESMPKCVGAWRATGQMPVSPPTVTAITRQRLWKENLRGKGNCRRETETSRNENREGSGYGNLGKDCATKKGKRTSKHEKGEGKMDLQM